MTKTIEAKRNQLEARLKADLPTGMRLDFQEFLDSFQDDILVELVRQWGGWNSSQTYGQVKAVTTRMIQAWQAGQERLRQEIQEL